MVIEFHRRIVWKRRRGRMEPEEAGGVSTGLARTSPVRRSSSVDRRSCRVPGVRLRLLRTDQSRVQLPHGRHRKRKRKVETTGLFCLARIVPSAVVVSGYNTLGNSTVSRKPMTIIIIIIMKMYIVQKYTEKMKNEK